MNAATVVCAQIISPPFNDIATHQKPITSDLQYCFKHALLW